jgi:hypothetical protein
MNEQIVDQCFGMNTVLHLHLWYTLVATNLCHIYSFLVWQPASAAFSTLKHAPIESFTIERRRQLWSITPEGSSEHDRETLMHISIRYKKAISEPKQVLQWAQQSLRSFPFAAILPVQPLTYKLVDEPMGLSLVFLRKKTEEKGAVDGGIDFFIQYPQTFPDKEIGLSMSENKIDIIARRNPEGQTVNKIFSEMLIIKAFVKSIVDSPAVTVDSIFHKWM